jgi:hypothetical protein
VPKSLITALGRQTDLSLDLRTSSVEVFSNSLFHGLVSQTTSTGVTPVLGSHGLVGPISSGGTIASGLAPESAFTLEVDGDAVPRASLDSWATNYDVVTHSLPAGYQSTGQLVLDRLPLNGLLALLTLILWATVWLGFGWVQRLEWLFTRRSRRAAARHAKRAHDE